MDAPSFQPTEPQGEVPEMRFLFDKAFPTLAQYLEWRELEADEWHLFDAHGESVPDTKICDAHTHYYLARIDPVVVERLTWSPQLKWHATELYAAKPDIPTHLIYAQVELLRGVGERLARYIEKLLHQQELGGA